MYNFLRTLVKYLKYKVEWHIQNSKHYFARGLTWGQLICDVDVDADDAIDDCTDAGVDLDCHKIIVLRTKQDIAHQRSPIQKRNRILQGGKKSAVPSLR